MLQERLRRETDWTRFVAVARGLAAERGLTLTEAEFEAARVATRRSFIERRL